MIIEMKKLSIAFMSLALISITACKNSKPSEAVAGTYTGSIQATYQDSTVILDSGVPVIVEVLTKNEVRVSGHWFNTFEVLVTWNGINVEPVDPNDPNVQEFVYIGDEDKLKFTYVESLNNAYYIGTK